MQRAVNPQTGEVLFLVDNKWTPPAQTAKNEAGDTAYLVGNRWEIVKTARLPEPILSPEEQMMGAVGAPSEGGVASIAPRKEALQPSTGGLNAMTADEYRAQVAAREAQGYDRTLGGSVIDSGVTLLKGAIGLPEAFVGLADIPTLGYAGKLLEQAGYRPKEAKAILDTYLSEAQQYANRQVKETEGFLPTIGAALQNPSTIVTAVGESLPQMIGGAGVARGILKGAPGLSPYLAGAAGEGILGAGAAAEQIRQGTKDGLLTGKQALSAVGSGVGTAAFGVAGGKLAKKFGFDDIDTLLVGGGAQTGSKSVKDFAIRATASGISEGVFEEMPQSAQETMWMNYATDKPLLEGVPEAAGMGLVTGATMGIGATALGGRAKAPEREKYVQPEGGLAELIARQKGFLTPEGRPPAPPAAPAAQGPMPPAPPAGPAETIQAPGSEAMDTQAMLEELINSVNYPQEKAPEVKAEKQLTQEEIDKQEQQDRFLAEMQDLLDDVSDRDDKYFETPPTKPESVKLYRGVPKGQEGRETVGGALFMSPDRKVAEEYAGPNGSVTEEERTFDNILRAPNWVSAKKQLGLPQSATMADLVGAAREAGHDGVTFNTTNGQEYIAINKPLKAPTTTPETREEYPTLSKTEVEELGLAPKPKVQKPAEPKIDYLNHPDNVGSDASSKREFDNKGKLQVAPQNIADGGTPFKSRAAADAARKNYPDMRVLPTADKKGFILAPKTPKQIEADKAKAKRLGLPMTTTKGTPMAAHQFITSEGGITKDAMKDLGMDENVRSGNRSLFTDTGMSVEQAYMKLQEAGYLEEGATQNDARNLITESVKKPKYRQQDTEEMAKRAEQADYEDYLKAEEEASLYSPVDEEMGYEMGDFEGTGYEGASPEVQAEVRALLAQADALGINTESIKEEIFYETENQSIQAYYKAFKSALEDAITASRQDRIEDTGQPGGAGTEFKLTSATPDEIRAKLYETESRAKEEERAKKAAEDKARADEQAAEFTLTGSDRAADVAAARGQRDIFAEAPAEEAPKPQTEQERTVSIPKKEFREDKETRGKSDHPALKMVFKGETPKSLIAKYGEKDVRFLGRLFDIDVKDKFNVAKKLIAIDKGLSLIRGKDKAYFDKMNKAQLGEFLEAVGQSAYGQKYQLVERLLKHEGSVMGKFYDKLQDLKHRAAVLNEARAGKPISEEVLKDYPDVAAYSLPRDSEGYKAAIRTLAVRALPTLGMDTPATIAAYREDAKNTKDPLEKNVANDIADYMESYYKSQQEKSNQTMAKLGSGTGPTMSEMIAENKRVKAELAALEKGEAAPVDNKKEIADLRKEQKALMMQIVKAGMEETPVQEARMAEIEKRIAELEGKPAKPEVKKQTPKQIRDQILDLEEDLDNEEDLDKVDLISSEIRKLQGQLLSVESEELKLNKLVDPAEYDKALRGFGKFFGDFKQARRELNYYRSEVDSLIKNGGEIYRLIFAKSENDIDEKNIGNHWTVHSSNIDKYVFNLGEDAGEDTRPYVVKAKVPPNSVSNKDVDIRGNPDEEEVNIVANKDDITYTVHEYSNKQVGPAIRELGKEEPAAPTEAEIEAAEEAAEEAIRNKAEAEIDEGPIGQAIAKIENGDIETKAQIRTFIVKLERDGTLDDVEDVREGLSDREQDASEVLDTLSGLLDDARDNAIDERFNELLEESAQDEVLPAEEPQIAGQVGFEPYTIEGDFTEVAEEQQRLMLEDQTENLSDDQVSTLEKHYGATIDSDEFFTKLREDVTNFIVKGATAVNGKIRAIIRQLANGVLAVGIAFNPQYMSQPINVFMPVDNVRTEEVLATVPDAATDKMSEPAKRAFAVIYPALQEQMVAKDKLFIMADKPSGRMFVFNPDGSLLLEKKSLFGLAKGDIYVGDNDKPQNRITPAGLFDLKFVDAQKGASEKRTAGDYDTGTVLAINDPEGTITIMHSVWLKEKDAAQRAAALRNESPADSRYSFGCINVDAPTYKYMVDNHAKQMDGAALFIVPEAGVDVMSFITGKGAMSEDLARIKIKPVTKEVRTPQRQATQAEAKTKTPGREQQFFSLEKQTSTPAFKKFFGDSKVVDENGNPLVVYHGTNEDFDVFDPYAEKKTQGGERLRGTNAIFFSSNPELASAYAGVAKSTLTGQSFAYPADSAYGGNVMPVYLSMQNPMIVDAEGQMYTKVEPLIREAKKKGHDGVIFKNVADQPGAAGSLQVTTHDAYVVFKPNQIKSATGNRGTFDESGNISMSVEGKKLPPGRSPELAAAARLVKEGKMTAAEFDKMVNQYKPIRPYEAPLKPATRAEMVDALSSEKKDKVSPDIPEGTRVGLRLDIPAFNRKGVYVVTIHEKGNASGPGKAIGYDSVAVINNVNFGTGSQKKALNIATGEAKDALQTMEGEFVKSDPASLCGCIEGHG